MIRFILSLCLLLSGAFAHTCSHHGPDISRACVSSLQAGEDLVGKAPVPGKRSRDEGTSAVEMEEDEDTVPSRKEIKNGNKLLIRHHAQARTCYCQKTGMAFYGNFYNNSSPAFIVNCVIRI